MRRNKLSSPALLYHYTSPAGLYGIVTSRAVWATHVRYLNDSQEYQQAINVARGLMAQRAEDATDDDEIRFLQGQQYDPLYIAETEAFVFSLSAEGDLLSQWRGYCPGTGGCAIGFNTEELRKRLSSDNTVHLEQCVYNVEAQQALLRQAIDRRASDFVSSLSESERPIAELDEFASLSLWSDIADLAPQFKHASFAEENEWRLVAHPRYRSEIQHRPGRISIVPYVPIPLGNDPLPIGEIIIGPSAHQELVAKSTRSFLHYSDVGAPVRESTIPFRSF